ncbi:MAG: ABC transporter permease [Thermomicrobiales bacterium]
MGLWVYIARRLVQSVVVLFIVSICTFLLAHAIPGDPINALISERQAERPEVRQALEERWGLNKPLAVQYLYYLRNLSHGDMGQSISTRHPVTQDLRKFVPATVELAFYAMLFALTLGVPLGIIGALCRNRWPDNISRLLALLGTSVPVFWLGLIMLYAFHVRLGWLPGPGRLAVGMEAPKNITGIVTFDAAMTGEWDKFWSAIQHLILPSIVLGSYAMGIVARMLRSSLIAAIGEDYIRTARSKGLAERRVVVVHALRNALIPTVTVLGLTFASLLAGAVLTETIFSWPGIGQYAVKTAIKLDYPGLLGVTLVVAVSYITFNLLVDVVYGFIDPRIRVS